MKYPTCRALTSTFRLLVLGLSAIASLLAAELSPDFPKEPPPLELAPSIFLGDNQHVLIDGFDIVAQHILKILPLPDSQRCSNENQDAVTFRL